MKLKSNSSQKLKTSVFSLSEYIKSFSQFSINESGLQNFSNLIKHLDKFSWTKVSIDDECKRLGRVQDIMGEGDHAFNFTYC